MKPHHLYLTLLSSALLVACAAETKVPKDVTDINPSSAKSEVIAAGDLKGLYVNAGENSPIVLIVPGSGPTDLDGNNPMGIQASTYKKLADSLAEQNISSVRVDKRGMFSSQAAGDPNAVTVDIYAQDYKNWTKAIKAQTRQPCVYMLGHSEGGIMVSAASIENSDVCGLILVSALGQSYGDILRQQLKANPANKPILDQALKAIDTLENGETVDTSTLHPALMSLFNPSVQGFMKSVMAINPAQLAKSAQKKTLIVQGDNDIQVSIENANKLAEATGGKLVIIEGVNHILKDAPESRSGNMKTYSNPDLPVSSEVVEAIASFIKQG